MRYEDFGSIVNSGERRDDDVWQRVISKGRLVSILAKSGKSPLHLFNSSSLNVPTSISSFVFSTLIRPALEKPVRLNVAGWFRYATTKCSTVSDPQQLELADAVILVSESWNKTREN